MITEQQQEQAGLYALDSLPPNEERAFMKELRENPELLEFTRGLQGAANLMAGVKPAALPPGLKGKVLDRIESAEAGRIATQAIAGLRFVDSASESGWKALSVPGAHIRLLSLERERGYAVLMGRLDPGARYPAHVNAGPEDFVVLTGDLHIGNRRLGPGDFHHADRGSQHEENYSLGGCTLLAVLTTDDPLVAFAIS
jgi:hypothetical protein